ncbi:hypothetical protein NXV86_26415 [Bacteroides sp. BFG-257]|uniref:hypothetical protein n=1 Tax=Bacteroides TaxID=816 RepID=UPI001CCD6C58|nr:MULTISPECIES: hypothetical protein [Bacteroides]UBD69638.1 hypothetical protein K6V21_25320 [Bacteroides cellulosilyticus]UVO98288.1 hypothetical protein NXV86_26415 [Bacteroides sp. BFG-257]
MSKLQDKILALSSDLEALLKSTVAGKRCKVLEEISDELDELIYSINKRYLEDNYRAMKRFYLKKMKRFEHEYHYEDENGKDNISDYRCTCPTVLFEKMDGFMEDDSFSGIGVNFDEEGGFSYSLEPDRQFTHSISNIYYLLPNEEGTYKWELEIDFPDNHENSRPLYDALMMQPLIQEHLVDGFGRMKMKVKLPRDVAFDVLYCLTDTTYRMLVKE